MEKTREKIAVDYEDRGDRDFGGKKEKNYRESISEIAIDPIKAKRQCKLDINGIEVYFPYSPYPNQLAYMEKGKQN
jgi:hypothetical protein